MPLCPGYVVSYVESAWLIFYLVVLDHTMICLLYNDLGEFGASWVGSGMLDVSCESIAMEKEEERREKGRTGHKAGLLPAV